MGVLKESWWTENDQCVKQHYNSMLLLTRKFLLECKKHGVIIKVFGSLLHPEKFHEYSDVDFAIVDLGDLTFSQLDSLAFHHFQNLRSYDLIETKYLNQPILDAVEQEGVEYV